MATKKDTAEVTIPALNIQEVNVRLVGDTPLISHAWSEKAKLMMLQKQTKKATTGKEIRRPAVEFAESLYWITEKPNLSEMTDEEAQKILAEYLPKSKFGFPTTAFKAAAIDAAFQQNVVNKKTTIRGAIHVIGELAEIDGVPAMREDMVRIGMGTADLRYRAEFKTWSVTLPIRYNVNSVSLEQLVNFFNYGGFSNGVGDWRPAKGGTYGAFHVESAQ